MARRPSRRNPANRSTPSYRRVTVLIAVAIVTSATVSAQSVSTGVQEYYVLGWEQHIWDMMDRVQNAQGGAQFADGMNSVVTATASADNQVVYYDHWEDGLDPELDNFPNINPAALQASTVVVGDGDISNGDLCDFNTNVSCGTDVVSAGDYINFNSDRGLGGGCTTPGTPERCSVPLNPRDPADIRFDGGDLIETTGGPLTLIHSQYPLNNFIGGSIEILSRQAVEAARSYSVPIGEDLYAGGTPTEPFHYVELELVAFEDTSITVDSPGAGSVSFTLDRGEHWSSMGFINDTSQPALGLTINSGTKVSTTAPISGLIFTGGDGTWATRLYTLLPDILHSTDYVTTAPGDVPNAGPTTNGTPQDRPANVYILNPDQVTSIDVDITDSSGTYTVNIPPNSMRSMDDIGAGRDIAPDSTVRLTSDRNFWGVTAYDWDTNISDWGHSWLAKRFLTSFYTVSFGPGNQNQPPDSSQYANEVFVAATADRTRVQFDLDNDGSFDAVDLDGDGTADSAPYPDNTYEVDMLSALRVIDPTDNDMTGARIIANKPVAVSWGQDTDRSYFNDQALDTGFTVYPVNQLFLDPALTIDKDVDTTVVPTNSVDPADRTATYTLTVRSYDFGPLTNVEVWDDLPADVFGDADYVPGSTLITCPDLTQGTGDPAFDDCIGGPGVDCGRLTWDIEGACGAGFSLAANSTLTVSYEVVIPAAPGGLPRQLTNTAHAQATLGGSVFSPFDTARVVQTDVTLTKAVDLTTPAPGDVVTFTLEVANTSTSVDETAVYISDPIPDDTTFVPGSITDDGAFNGSGVFDPSQNAVVWNAATFSWGDSATLSFQVQVNPAVPAGTEIPNRAGYESFQTPFFLSNEVDPVVQGPLLQAAKTIVGNPSVVHPSETVTFQVQIDNNGTAAATDVFLSDPFPANAAYVAGSMSWSLNSGPFIGLSDASDGVEASGGDGRAFADHLEFRLASLGASQDITVRFRVVVDPGTAGEFLSNQAVFNSDETPSTDTNLVQVPIVGDSQVTGHVFLDSDGDGTQDPGEPDIPNVDVVVTDPTGAVQRVTTDANGDYTATVLVLSSSLGCYLDGVSSVAYNGSNGTLVWTATPWAEYGYQADTNPNTDPMSIENDPIVGGGNLALRILGVNVASHGFTRTVDLDPGNQATLSFRYHRRGLEADDIIVLEVNYGSGFATIDSFGQPPGGGTNQNDADWLSASYNLDAAQLPADPVIVQWRSTSGYNFNTDQFFLDDVEVCVSDVTDAEVTLNVDESDPDFPAGAVLTTANDPQTVAAVPGGSVASGDVGYRQTELLFTKTSDAVDNQVSPGQTVTYTLEVTNNTGATQTGINIADPLPTGTTYVAGSTQVSGAGSNVLRVTEYYLAPGVFSGTGYNLTLDQNLVADYFVIVQGSDGDGTGTGNLGPDANYAALTDDPFGTGQLGVSAGSDVIRLQRNATADSWVGVVTVVECLSECSTRGFSLLDVRVVNHAGASTAGSAMSTTPWTDLTRVLLMGGFNGAGCTTAESSNGGTKVCHTRIFPSGDDQINWTRDPNDVTLTTATSTVMAVQWGSDWTVQRVRVQGNNGGDGADAAGEYNTAAISPVARANTWVWGTGHTAVEGIGEAAEGALITLGDGVAELPTENLVAVANEYAALSTDFEVYALTHPDLAVDRVFKTDGDGGSLTVDVGVATAGAQRMALSYNGQNGTGNAYPRPMFSARYTGASTVRLERRRTGQDFPAWVQGVDFSGIVPGGPPGGGVPPDLIVPSDGYTLAPGATMTVTFQVEVDDPLAGGITDIVNTATLDTSTLGPYEASVTDAVVRAGVVIEYDNAGFGFADETVSYAHVVENTGEGDDSYAITLAPKLGWPTQLIQPSSGAVIAADANGDGVWDGGVEVNTGTLPPGGSIQYELRVAIPGGTAAGTAESTALRATSDRNPGRFDIATDETMVVDAVEPVAVLPDNSGVAAAGGTAVYTHRVLNTTGSSATFDLTASREDGDPVWPTAFYWDANNDGVYTPGIDVQIVNTRQLANGQSQTIFVVVSVPVGVGDFSTDVVHIKAARQSDPDVFGTATDTTTVRPPIVMDLSGGGTRWVDAGDTPVFPGVLRNFTGADDVFSLDITESWFSGVDGLAHPVELVIDTTGDGVPDTSIATDDDGDGTWDSIDGAYDVFANGQPDVAVAAGSNLAYELVRPVSLLQGPSRDPVTLTALSDNTGEQDSITATLVLAAATDASLASFEAWAYGGRVVVEWQTSVEIGTLGFDLWRLRSDGGGYTKVNASLVRGRLGAMQGGTYRLEDPGARSGGAVTYILAEADARGRGRNFGPFTVTPREDASRAKSAAFPVSGESWTPNASRVRGPRIASSAPAAKTASELSGLVKVAVEERGLVWVSADELAGALDLPVATVSQHIAAADIWINSVAAAPAVSDGIFSDGFETGDAVCWEAGCQQPDVEADGIAWIAASDHGGLYFYGEGIDSSFTRDNAYWFGVGSGRTMAWRNAAPVRLPAAVTFAEDLHFEEELWPLTSVITDPEGDFWMWDYFFSNTPGANVKEFPLTVPDVAENGGGARLVLYLQGASISEITPNHTIAVRLNGTQVGETSSWNGDDPHVVIVDFPQALLAGGDNTLEITALAAPGLDYDVFYLDAVELRYDRLYRARGDRLEATATATGTIMVEGFSTDDITVFDLDDPTAPVVLEGASVEAGSDGFDISFRAEAGTRFLATTASAARPPARVVADTSSNLAASENAGRWVIIAGAGLEDEAEAFAAYRRSRGMSAVVARVEDIYDEFSAGIVDPWAIRDFLRHASENWAGPPEYAFLLGDGSIDYKDHDGLGECLIPAPFTVTDDGLVPSDNALADWLGNDGVPEIAIGRLPAQSTGDAAAYRQKVAAFEASSGAWKRRTLWLADVSDIGGEFGDDTDAIIDNLPETFEVEQVFLDNLELEDAWELTLQEIDAGAGWVNFLGHGGLDRIADQGLLLTEDVAAMENGERAPFVSALTCIVGRFDIPDFDTFAEALLLKGDGGAIAVWSPAAFSMNENAKRLGAAHTATIAGGGHTTIGDSVRAALAAYVGAGESDPSLVRIVTLLGDPATAIDW